jgi:hypothetical protein
VVGPFLTVVSLLFVRSIEAPMSSLKLSSYRQTHVIFGVYEFIDEYNIMPQSCNWFLVFGS